MREEASGMTQPDGGPTPPRVPENETVLRVCRAIWPVFHPGAKYDGWPHWETAGNLRRAVAAVLEVPPAGAPPETPRGGEPTDEELLRLYAHGRAYSGSPKAYPLRPAETYARPGDGSDRERLLTLAGLRTVLRATAPGGPRGGPSYEWLEGEFKRMCGLLQDTCQRFHLGLGGEDTATLVTEAVVDLTDQKNGAYRERDMCVALIAKLAAALGWRVGMARHEGEWEDDWRWIIYIDLPTGQVSWHIHASEREWFDFPVYPGKWDGHSTDEKYERMASLSLGGPAPSEEPILMEVLDKWREFAAEPGQFTVWLERKVGIR